MVLTKHTKSSQYSIRFGNSYINSHYDFERFALNSSSSVRHGNSATLLWILINRLYIKIHGHVSKVVSGKTMCAHTKLQEEEMISLEILRKVINKNLDWKATISFTKLNHPNKNSKFAIKIIKFPLKSLIACVCCYRGS